MKRLATLVTVFALCGCTMCSVEPHHESSVVGELVPKASLSSRERAVIQSMLEYEVKGRVSAKSRVVLSELSSADMLIKSLDDSAASDRVPLSAIRSFRAANREKLAWPRDLDKRCDIHFLTAEEHREIWKDQRGWERFYQKFPTAYGVTTMSRAGFSEDGRVALVYRGCQADWLSGGGWIYVLRFKWGRWVVTEEHVGGMWVS